MYRPFHKRNHFRTAMASASSTANKVVKVKSATDANGKVWTKDDIKQLLATNDAAVLKAMLRIFEYQTFYEQQAEHTQDYNGVGFSGVDGEILSSFTKQFQTRGFLSPKQMTIARKRMQKYANQLLAIMAGSIKPPTS
jgi:hypothetical protein